LQVIPDFTLGIDLTEARNILRPMSRDDPAAASLVQVVPESERAPRQVVDDSVANDLLVSLALL
jgi:hypothetical protein